MRRAAAVAAACFAGLAGLAGCTVDDLDLTGKRCPCAPGWMCDPASNRCLSTAGNGDAGSSSVVVSNLRVLWSTANQIRWAWDASGPPDQLREYQLVVGPSEPDVTARSAAATVWTRKENPELGRFFLPRTGGQDPTVNTTTDGHQPSTTYFGQLIAIDTSGRTSASNIAAQQTTDPPLASIVIFHDADTAGYSLPPELKLSQDRPFMGTSDYEFVSVCPVGMDACYENLRRQELAIALDPIGQGSFLTDAYLEFALASDAAVTSYWSDVRLAFGDGINCIGDSCGGHFIILTVRSDDRYRVIQVPLRALLVKGVPLTYAMMKTGLFGFGVGGLWSNGAKIRIDEIRIAY